MADWSINPRFHEEPTYTPTGDECESWARGELCGKSDCSECGVQVSALLYADARHDMRGLMRLAREVGRVQAKHGSNVPDCAVTIGDVVRAATARLEYGYGYPTQAGMRARIAYAEGCVDAITCEPAPESERQCYPAGPSCPSWEALHIRWCYFLGRVAPALYRLNLWLETRRHAELAEQAQEFRDYGGWEP